jgi:hypothetical protein
VSRKNINL